MDAPRWLFRGSWAASTGVLGALASTLAVTALVFRHIGRDGAQGTGSCAAPVLDGFEVYCQLGAALVRIAGGLNVIAILVAGAACACAYRWARARDEAKH